MNNLCIIGGTIGYNILDKTGDSCMCWTGVGIHPSSWNYWNTRVCQLFVIMMGRKKV